VLSFELAEPAEVTIRIYAVSGKLVRTDFPGFDRNLGAGVQQIHWDGRDEDGDLVANGVYLCSISATGLSGDQASTVVRALVSR
jgi:flagellar hook assembly protein FlgD